MVSSDQLTEVEKRRCEARLKAYECYIKHDKQMPAAIAAFEQEWNSQHEGDDDNHYTNVRSFILRAVDKLQTHYTLRTLSPPGPTEKVPAAIVKEAADIVARGHTLECMITKGGNTYVYYEHRYFTSVKQAILHSGQLADIVKEYKVGVKYLLKKFRKYCPDLQYHALYMRDTLKQSVLKERSAYGRNMLTKIDPIVGRADYLLDIHWMDECTIWVGKDLIKDRLHVWSYRSKTEGHAPEPNPLFNAGKSFKVNILLVVNGRTGCTHAEILTGTQGIPPDFRHTDGMCDVIKVRKSATPGIDGWKYKVG